MSRSRRPQNQLASGHFDHLAIFHFDTSPGDDWSPTWHFLLFLSACLKDNYFFAAFLSSTRILQNAMKGYFVSGVVGFDFFCFCGAWFFWNFKCDEGFFGLVLLNLFMFVFFVVELCLIFWGFEYSKILLPERLNFLCVNFFFGFRIRQRFLPERLNFLLIFRIFWNFFDFQCDRIIRVWSSWIWLFVRCFLNPWKYKNTFESRYNEKNL